MVILAKELEHDNIVPFYGVSTIVADFALVSPWYKNGNIVEYLKKKPYVNRFDLVSTFRQSPYFQCLPTPMDSYWMWLVDCTLYTRIY